MDEQAVVHPCSALMLRKDLKGKQWAGNTDIMEGLHSKKKKKLDEEGKFCDSTYLAV